MLRSEWQISKLTLLSKRFVFTSFQEGILFLGCSALTIITVATQKRWLSGEIYMRVSISGKKPWFRLIILWKNSAVANFEHNANKTCHLRVLSTMTPLSIENVSVGSPAMFHALILIAWPSVLLNEKSSEQGMFLDCIKTSTKKISYYSFHDNIS